MALLSWAALHCPWLQTDCCCYWCSDYSGNPSGARRAKKRSCGESPGDGQTLRSSGRQINVRVKRTNNPPPGQVDCCTHAQFRKLDMSYTHRHNIKPVAAEINNTDHLASVHHSTGKQWILGFMWFPSKHPCRSSVCFIAPVTLKTLILQQDSVCCHTTGNIQSV